MKNKLEKLKGEIKIQKLDAEFWRDKYKTEKAKNIYIGKIEAYNFVLEKIDELWKTEFGIEW